MSSIPVQRSSLLILTPLHQGRRHLHHPCYLRGTSIRVGQRNVLLLPSWAMLILRIDLRHPHFVRTICAKSVRQLLAVQDRFKSRHEIHAQWIGQQIRRLP
jgi:hypothetical protein